MLTKDRSATVATYRAAGTVTAGDIEAIAGNETGGFVVVVVEGDFDGYLAEIGRAIMKVAARGAPTRRLALVVPDEMIDEAEETGLTYGGAGARLYRGSQALAACDFVRG